MTKKEIRLIKGIKSGNEKYLEKCIRQYTPYVAYIVGNIIGLALPQEDKEEVISDVFVTLWKKRELLDENRLEKLQGYIGTIARNLSKEAFTASASSVSPLENLASAGKVNVMDKPSSAIS